MKKSAKLLAMGLTAAMLAVPSAAMTPVEYYVGEFWKAETERLRDQPEETHYTVSLFEDPDHTKPLSGILAVDPDKYVYYSIDTDPGYYCKWITAAADYMDHERIRFGEQTPAMPEANCVLLGDVNSDHRTNLRDVTLLMQHMTVSYYDYPVEMRVADFNGDGKFNALDCSMLMKYIAGWDVEMMGESMRLPDIYCDYNEPLERVTLIERYDHTVNVSVIKSADGLEEYIAENTYKYGMDGISETNTYTAEELRRMYASDAEFFRDNRLVIVEYCSPASNGSVSVQTDGDILRLVIDYIGGGIPMDNKLRYHKVIPVSYSSRIDTDRGVEVIMRDTNLVGSRYLLDYVDTAVDSDRIVTKYY